MQNSLSSLSVAELRERMETAQQAAQSFNSLSWANVATAYSDEITLRRLQEFSRHQLMQFWIVAIDSSFYDAADAISDAIEDRDNA